MTRPAGGAGGYGASSVNAEAVATPTATTTISSTSTFTEIVTVYAVPSESSSVVAAATTGVNECAAPVTVTVTAQETVTVVSELCAKLIYTANVLTDRWIGELCCCFDFCCFNSSKRCHHSVKFHRTPYRVQQSCFLPNRHSLWQLHPAKRCIQGPAIWLHDHKAPIRHWHCSLCPS